MNVFICMSNTTDYKHVIGLFTNLFQLDLQEQYIFIYDALAEAVVFGDTAITAADFTTTYQQMTKKIDGTSKMRQQFENVATFNPKHKKSDVSSGLLPKNRNKNRDLKLVARKLGRYRVRLIDYTVKWSYSFK